MEMISAIVYQLTRNLTPEQIKEGGFDAYFVDHTTGIYPQSASGVPWSAATFQSKGDPITDLFEDMAAEQKARTTYDNLLRLIDDPDVREPLKFLREREVVHFQRFGDALRVVQDNLDAKNYYAYNPSIDIRPKKRNNAFARRWSLTVSFFVQILHQSGSLCKTNLNTLLCKVSFLSVHFCYNATK